MFSKNPEIDVFYNKKTYVDVEHQFFAPEFATHITRQEFDEHIKKYADSIYENGADSDKSLAIDKLFMLMCCVNKKKGN